MVENDYDTFAEAYAAENETSLINAYYTRPAILDLAGDVTGRRILDAGCGAGPLFEALRDRGANVTGFDSSAKMLELARKRLGDDAALRVADIGEQLPYPDGAFDDVIAALVLHYLEDWTAPLAEIRRVLKPGGRLIMAVNHPIIFKLVHPEGDYFKTVKWSDEYTFSGQKAVLTYWHRPLHAMTDAFTAAGFRTSVVSEPHPAPGARERFPEELAGKTAFLSFLFFVLEADQEVGCQASATRSTALRAGSRAAWS
ncbi:class I SAM-dependent methyltransferase [Amycolatopsis japonica]|uniref:class I SAM-dependent methyltransferase n=1 Tax=Amycolatopsis japonica TaxID=208439 RepID=UPI003D9F9199